MFVKIESWWGDLVVAMHHAAEAMNSLRECESRKREIRNGEKKEDVGLKCGNIAGSRIIISICGDQAGSTRCTVGYLHVSQPRCDLRTANCLMFAGYA